MLVYDVDGAITLQPLWNGYAEAKRLNSFTDLRCSVIEEMLGELPIGEQPRNAGCGAGPAYSQLFFDEESYADR